MISSEEGGGVSPCVLMGSCSSVTSFSIEPFGLLLLERAIGELLMCWRGFKGLDSRRRFLVYLPARIGLGLPMVSRYSASISSEFSSPRWGALERCCDSSASISSMRFLLCTRITLAVACDGKAAGAESCSFEEAGG